MSDHRWDVVVIGGGPAGLEAGLTLASEGMRVLVVDRAEQFGGQAGTSSLIENILGHAAGISGPELTARSLAKAREFGCEFAAPFHVTRIRRRGRDLYVGSTDGEELRTRAVLVATGVHYRRLPAMNVASFLGCGVSYGAPRLDQDMRDQHVYIVGAANAAGQAALWLSRCVGCDIHILCRGDGLAERMSRYLIDRIEHVASITVHTHTEVVAAHGGLRLEALTLRSPGGERQVPADRLMVLIGAVPHCEWLNGHVGRDANGFVQCDDARSAAPGIFVAGDIRSGSVPRVAAAAGDGAIAVHYIHRYLGSL